MRTRSTSRRLTSRSLSPCWARATSMRDRLGDDLLDLFGDYHAKFDLASKPATHLAALSTLTDEELLKDLPDVLSRLVEQVEAKLAELPE